MKETDGSYDYESVIGVSKSATFETDKLMRVEFSVETGRDPINNTAVVFSASAGGGYYATKSVTKKTGIEGVYYAIIEFRYLQPQDDGGNVSITNEAETVIYSPTAFYLFGPDFQ